MVFTKLKFLIDWQGTQKKGDVVNYSKKSAAEFIRLGVCEEVIDNNKVLKEENSRCVESSKEEIIENEPHTPIIEVEREENNYIPKQLKNKEFRFIRIKHNSKVPIGEKWQYPYTESNFRYDDSVLVHQLKNSGNIGICGGFGGLIVYDFDDMDVYEKLKNKMPATFQIKSGGKSVHNYYITDNTKSGVIRNKTTKKTMIDMQGAGKQVITVPSKHKDTKKEYTVLNDVEILRITREELTRIIREEIPEIEEQVSEFNIVNEIEETDQVCKLIKEKQTLLSYLQEIGLKNGKNHSAGLSCPFCNHNDCFTVQEHTFHCFSTACERSGNLFHAYMYKNNCGFKTARKYFNDKLDITNTLFKEYEEKIKIFDKDTSFTELLTFVDEMRLVFTDPVVFNRLFGLLSKQSKKPKKDLIDNSNSGTYFLTQNYGYRFTKNIFNIQNMNFSEFQISDFKILEKQNIIDYDVFNDKTTNRNRIFAVPSLKKESIVISDDDESIPLLLNHCKNKSSYCIADEDTQGFIKLFKHFPIKEKRGVTCHCYHNKTYYEPGDYETYRINHKKEDFTTTNERENCYESDSYNEFLKIKYDKDKIKQIIEALERIPRDDEERKIWKTILAWSVASTLKMELHRMKATIYPFLVVIGEHDTGKTKINEIAIIKMWNNDARPTSDFGGVAGARLVNLPSDIRPICYQEVEEFPKNWMASLKEAMTSGKFTMSRGMKHGRYELTFYQNIAIDTNDFSVTSEALENRAIFLLKEQPKNKNIDNSADLNYLIDNIHYLGKFLYDCFKNIDMTKTWEDAKSYVFNNCISKINNEKIRKEGRRATEKLATIRFGESILEDAIGVYKDTVIDYSIIYSDSRVELFNREKLLKEKIQLLLSHVQVKDRDKIFTLGKILNDTSIINNTVSAYLKDNYGVVVLKVGKEKYLGITPSFIPKLNTELERNKSKKVMDLKTLSKELKIEGEYKLYKYIHENNKTVSASLCLKLSNEFMTFLDKTEDDEYKEVEQKIGGLEEVSK